MDDPRRRRWERLEHFDLIHAIESRPPRARALIVGHGATLPGVASALESIAAALERRGVVAFTADITGAAGPDGTAVWPEGRAILPEDVAAWAGRVESPWTLAIGVGLGAAMLLAAAADLPAGCALALLGAPLEATAKSAWTSGDPVLGRERTVSLWPTGDRVVASAVLDLLAEGPPGRSLAGAAMALERPLLAMALPGDEVTGRAHSELLFELAPRPKTLIVLDGADFQLGNARARGLGARLVAEWAEERLVEREQGRLPRATAVRRDSG